MNRTYCPQKPSGLSGCSSPHFVGRISVSGLTMTMKAGEEEQRLGSRVHRQGQRGHSGADLHEIKDKGNGEEGTKECSSSNYLVSIILFFF